MRINEIVKESDLQEGPILNKIGSAIGKGVGTLAKGVGAVAGGIAGLGAAAKKGFQAGKATVSGAGDTDTTPAAGTAAKPAAPTADTGASNTSAPAATQPSAAGSAEPKQTPAAEPAPAAAPAAEPTAAAPAADKGATDTQAPAAEPAPATTPAADATQATPAPSQTQTTTGQSAANDTQYKQAQKAIAALQPADQKQILTALEADPKVKSAIEKAAQPKQQPKQDPDSQAFGQMANQLSKGTDPAPAEPATTPAATPTTTPAAGATDTAVPAAEVPAKKTKTASRVPKKAAPSQAEIDADRENNPNIQMSNNSIIRTGRNLSEAPLITAAPAAQPPAAKSSAALDNLKAFKKGWDSGADTSAVGQGPKLQDPSGRVPPDMLERLNKLQSAQRTELYNLLVKMNP